MSIIETASAEKILFFVDCLQEFLNGRFFQYYPRRLALFRMPLDEPETIFLDLDAGDIAVAEAAATRVEISGP